jgi:hypothetical protein
MKNYTKQAFDEMFEKRERELLKEEREQERMEREGQNLKEHQRVKQLLEDFDF